MPGMAAGDPYNYFPGAISEGCATWYGESFGEPFPDGKFGIQDHSTYDVVLYSRVNEQDKSVKLSDVNKDVTKLVSTYYPDQMFVWDDMEYALTHLRFENCSIVVDEPQIPMSSKILRATEFWDNCELVFNDTQLEMYSAVSVGALRVPAGADGIYSEYTGRLTFTCSRELANNPKWQEGEGYVSQTLMYSNDGDFAERIHGNIYFSFGDATSKGKVDDITGLKNVGVVSDKKALDPGEVGLVIRLGLPDDMYGVRTTPGFRFTISVVANLDSTSHQPREASWTGSQSMVWNAENNNWLRVDIELPYQFKAGDTAIFGDEGSGVVTLEGSIAPKEVRVTNSAGHDYTFTGSGKLTGEMNLTKDGEGTLTINTANDYSGCTAVYNGTLAVGENGSLGSGDFYVRENGVLQFSKTTLKQVWVSKIDNSELLSQYFESAPYGKMIDVTLGTEDVTIDDTTVTYDTIIGKGKGISSISCLNITSNANLMIKNLTIEASSDFMKNFKTMIPPHTEIHVGDHVITLQDVDIDVTNLDYRLVEDGYLFDLKSLINCNLEMENVTIDASGLDLDLAPDQKITVDFGDDVFIKDAKDLRLLLGNNISQEIRLAEQNGQMIFTSLVPRDDSYGGAVPEPTTGTLSLLALAGLCARRRRK